jgi:flavin reductase (DIM6/NTAB) family NADH-FMN oxidoreductase RutF
VAPTSDDFREAVSRFATGITVVTCLVDGVDHAMTANAFASVSLEPLLVLVCVERDSRFHEAISATEFWGVSLLTTEAERTARWLATKGRPLLGQLDEVPHHASPKAAVAWLDDSMAALECRTIEIVRAGDHDIVLGEVIALENSQGAEGSEGAQGVERPLLYFRRGYRSIAGLGS